MRYVFGDCVLDTTCYVLYRTGQPIRLRPKVFHLLVYLLTQRERVVSKQELSEQVWSGQCISDATLESTLAAARRALGGRRRDHGYIQTLRGYGYRFVVPVEERSDPLPSAADNTHNPVVDAPTAIPRKSRQTTTAAALPAVEGEGGDEALLVSSEPSPQAAESLPAVSERKQVTVLCCASSPAPGPRAQVALDTLHQQVQALYELVQREAQPYGGTMQPVLGEQVLVVFGAPAAQEDHAQRAVLVALGLRERLHTRHTTATLPDVSLVGRISLHTGPVAIGGLGDEPAAAAAVVGDTIGVAMALQERAAPGAVVCSATTARLVQGMVRLVARAPGAPGEPSLPAYEVRGRRPRQSPRQLRQARPLSPFVGRAQVLATLETLLVQAAAGQGQVVGIVGEPGIGKSRLVYEFRRALRGQRLTYLASGGLAYGQHTPYLPVCTLLRTSCGLTATESPTVSAAKVHRWLTEVGLEPAEWAPYLLRLLDVPMAPDPLAALSPQALRARTTEALVQCTLQGARRQPLVLEVENLHWIDPSSEEVLTALAERLRGAAILLLTTFRPGYRPPWLDKSYASQVALTRLSPTDSRRVVQAVRGPRPLPEALLQAILAKADGNPFFLEELARAVVDHDPAQLLPAVVPETVQTVLAARMDRLPSPAKRLLQMAAVIGKDVPLAQLRAVAGLPEAVLDELLAQLQAGEFLYEAFLEGAPAYTFTHALTQEVAYGSLLQEWRRALHRRLLEVIEALNTNRLAEQVEWLAHHALQGAVWDKAVAYGWQAGAKAAARSAYREAVAFYEQALVALQHLPQSRTTGELAVDLRFDLRASLLSLGEYGRFMNYLREAETFAEALCDHRRLGRIAAYKMNYFLAMGDYGGAIACGQHTLGLATALGDIALRIKAHQRLGHAYYTLGDYRQAMDLLKWNLVALEDELLWERFGEESPPSVQSRSWLVRCLAMLGEFAEGIAHGEEGLRIAEAVDQPYSLIHICTSMGMLYLRKGDLHQAIPVLERSLALCKVANVPILFPSSTSNAGYAYTLAGRVAEALPLFEQTVELITSVEQVTPLAAIFTHLSEGYLLSGRIAEASDLAWRALARSRERKERGAQAGALRLLGEIATHGDHPDAAQAVLYYRQALALAEELGMRPLQAHCHLGLGTLYAKIGRPEQARAELSTAIALYRTMEMTFWLPQAEAAMASL